MRYYQTDENGRPILESGLSYHEYCRKYNNTVFPRSIEEIIPDCHLEESGYIRIADPDYSEAIAESAGEIRCEFLAKNKDGEYVRVISTKTVTGPEKENHVINRFNLVSSMYSMLKEQYIAHMCNPNEDFFKWERALLKLDKVMNSNIDPFYIDIPMDNGYYPEPHCGCAPPPPYMHHNYGYGPDGMFNSCRTFNHKGDIVFDNNKLDVRKEEMIEELKYRYNTIKKHLSIIVPNIGRVRCSLEDVTMLEGLLKVMKVDNLFTTDLVLIDNRTKQISIQQLDTVIYYIHKVIIEAAKFKWSIRHKISTAKTHEDLNEIELTISLPLIESWVRKEGITLPPIADDNITYVSDRPVGGLTKEDIAKKYNIVEWIGPIE